MPGNSGKDETPLVATNPMQLHTLISWMESFAPPHLAEPWDNVGLIVGDPRQAISRVMLTIDYTPLVAEEAREAGCDCIIAYHPPIFEPIKRVTVGGSTGLIHDAIRRGVAIYSPHTALDVADGGTNDVLADALALTARRPLKTRDGKPTHYKLVTFVPSESLEKVAAALFAAGAGRIGNYSHCSFRTTGTGTFFGEQGTDPAVGQAGRLEQVDEIRIETLVEISRAADVVAALKSAHPYEEVAFDLQSLAAAPAGVGIGRVGRLPGDATIDMLLNMLKRNLGINHVLLAGDPRKLVKSAAVCAGACGGELLSAAIEQKVDLYVTGELRHHDALRALRNNVAVVCTLHSNSERATLSRLAARISEALPQLPVRVSDQDRDPFEFH